MAALQGALALEQVDRGAVAVAGDLDLDVAHLRQVALDDQLAAAERLRRLAHRALDARLDVVGALDHRHAATAAAGDRLQQHRQRHVADARRDRGRIGQARVGAVDDRQADARRLALRAGLAADPFDRRRVGADEDQAGALRPRARRRRSRTGSRSRDGSRRRRPAAPRRAPRRCSGSSRRPAHHRPRSIRRSRARGAPSGPRSNGSSRRRCRAGGRCARSGRRSRRGWRSGPSSTYGLRGEIACARCACHAM